MGAEQTDTESAHSITLLKCARATRLDDSRWLVELIEYGETLMEQVVEADTEEHELVLDALRQARAGNGRLGKVVVAVTPWTAAVLYTQGVFDQEQVTQASPSRFNEANALDIHDVTIGDHTLVLRVTDEIARQPWVLVSHDKAVG